MVFESLVVNLVNTYLGKYIKNLDSSNLDLGVWRGDVVLNNLELKDDALAELDLPVEVKSGYIGKLSLEIPWSNIYTKPVVVKIEDVFVLAAPVTELEFDVERAEERLKAVKRRKLQAIDKSNKPSNNEVTEDSALPDSYTFFEKLAAQIIKNVQVFIKNIHIRYEDQVTTPGSSFAVGITLKHLTAETTDEFWKPCVVDATEKKIFKFVSLDSLAVYWNTNTRSSHYGGSKDWQLLLRADIKTKATKKDNYEYVLEPFSLEAQMQIDQNSAVTNNKPKLTVEVVQHDMVLSLSRPQFHSLMDLIESFEMMIANEPYRKYRPKVSLRNNVRRWWKYAFTAIVCEKIRTWSWENIKRHRSLYHEYKSLFMKKLLCEERGIEKTSALKTKIRDTEDKLQLCSILIAREHAQAEFKANPGIVEDITSEEPNSGWWNWIFGSSEVKNKEETLEDLDWSSSLSLSALSPEEQQRLYDALDYSDITEETKYPKEYVKYMLLFSLENFEVRLMNELRRNLSFVSMKCVSGCLQHRPSASNTSFKLEVNDINVYGHQSNQDDPPPQLLYLHKNLNDEDLIFFEFSFELNPIHVSADYAIFVKLDPVKIVHDTNTVMQLVNFVKMPECRAIQELTQVASSGLTEIQNRTRAGLEYAVSQQTTVYFDVNLKSPCIVVPEYGAMERPGSVFVVDFGHLTIKTDLNSKQSLIQEATESELENMLCDNFNVVLSNMQVLIADKDDDWLSAYAQSSSPFHLLPASEINLEIQKNTNIVYSSLPEVSMKGILQQLEFRLSEEKYRQLMQFISNLPLLTEPLDEDERDSRFLTTYPVNLSRHSSRISLEEAADIQIVTREALAIASARQDEDEFQDAEDIPLNNDDEEEWVLACESLPEKPSHLEDDQKSAFSEQMEVAMSDKVTVSGEFSIKKVSVVFTKWMQTVDQPYICLEVNELNSNVSVKEYEIDVSAKLGSIHLIDYLFDDIDGSPLTVLSSVAEKQLISLFYRKVDPGCPYLDSSFNGVQFFIKTEFNALNVLLHREGITTFQNFILSLIESEKPNLQKLGKRVSSYLEVIPEDESVNVAQLNTPETEDTPAAFGKTAIETTLDEFCITLSANNENFALFKVNGLHVDSLFEDKQTYIKARLECFTVEDLHTDTLYKKILAVEDDNLCDVEATLYSTKTRDPADVDTDVCCQFGRLKFVFLHKFIIGLQDFFSSFASAENRQYAQNATTQAVQIQVEHLQNTSPKVGLKVDITAPVIKIPLSHLSNEGIIVDLGSLIIRNKLEYQKEENSYGNNVLVDKINVTLEFFNVIRFNNAVSWSGSHNLVDPTGLEITLTRCLQGFCNQTPATEVEAVLRLLTTSVDEGEFLLLMRIWAENIQHPILQENDGSASVEEISHMPEVEQHLIANVDGRPEANNGNQENSLKICAVIDYVSLQFPRSINHKRIPFLELNVQKLKAAITFSESYTYGSANLGDLYLNDYSTVGMGPLSVLESSQEQDLISLQYTQEVSQSLPSKTTQTLDVLSTVIKLHFEEQSLVGIQNLVNSFIDSFNSSTSSASFMETDAGAKLRGPRMLSSKSEDDQAKAKDNIKFTVNLNKLEVTLSRKETQIVEAVIEDIFTEVIIDAEKLVVTSRQKGLSVTDLNPLSNYPNVITIEGDKLFDFEYQTLPSICSTNNREKNLTTPHSLLCLDIGKVRFVFLYKLLTDVQDFLQALVSPETTTYSYELAQKTVQEQLENIETQGTRIALKVSIEAPIIIVPSHSQSTDCLIADLGQLHAKNKFTLTRSVMSDVSHEVIVERTDVDLQSVQLSRGTLDLISSTMARRSLIKPLKMVLTVCRCMQTSAHWLPYLDMKIGLEHVEMNMDEADYQLLVSVMQQNYAEKEVVYSSTSGLSGDVFVSEVSGVDDQTPADVDIPDMSVEPLSEEPVSEESVQENEIWDSIALEFTFSGLNISLYNNEDNTKLTQDSSLHHSLEKSLCTCELQESSGKVMIRSDASINLTLYLYGCIVEDARPSKMTAFPRMLSHRTEQNHGRKRSSTIAKTKRPSMIEVCYKQTASGETHVDIILQDPVLYISFPLLWSLLDFFAVNSDVEFNDAGTTVSQSTRDGRRSAYVLEVIGTLKNPEIVLLGEPESPSSSALIVQTSVEFEYKLVDNQQNFSTTSKELVVHSCRYPDREKTFYKVVKPCAIDFRYSYPGGDCEGQEIHLSVPDMKIKVSPLLLKTLLAIYKSFYGDQEVSELETPEPVFTTEKDKDFWKPQPIVKDDWYQERAPARVPSRIRLNTTVTEKFSMEIKSVRLTLYNEVMAHRVPLLLLNSNIVSHVKDWSSELKLAANISVEAWYYNETLAAWEPLMESEESLNARHLWELELKVFKTDSHMLSFTPGSEEQKLFDEEDFKSLASSPVIEGSRHGSLYQRNHSIQFSTSEVDQKRHPTEHFESSFSNRFTREDGLNLGIKEHEVLDGHVQRSPVLSVSCPDASDNIPQATYIVLSSDDIMQLSVTRVAVDVLTDISVIFADVTSAAPSENFLVESPFVVINDLGVHASVVLSHRHETMQDSTPELTVKRRNRSGFLDHTDGHGNTSESYPTKRCKLDASTGKSKNALSMLSKDDCEIKEKHETHEYFEDEGIGYQDEPDGRLLKMVKGPGGKRFARSVSMPAKDMCNMVQLVEEKESSKAQKLVAEKELEDETNASENKENKSVSEENLIVDVANRIDPPGKSKPSETCSKKEEELVSTNEYLQKQEKREAEKKSSVDLPDGSERCKMSKNKKSSQKRKKLFSIEEDIQEEEEKKEDQSNKVDNDKAPSFISGAFATMGLIAGISGHPVTGADQLAGVPEENKVLFNRPEYKKADDYISIKVDGFDELSFVLVTHDGRFLYQLCPRKHNRYYYIVVQIEIKHGQKRVTIRAPLQLKNNLDVAVDLIQSGAMSLNNSSSTGESGRKEDRRICTVQPKEIGNLPLLDAHKGNFFIRPVIDGFKKSTISVSWKDFSERNETSILTCLPKETGPNYTFCIKILCEKDALNKSPLKFAPHHILQLHPTISFGNFLPFSLKLKLEESDASVMDIEPGKRHQLTCVTTNKSSEFSLKIEQYMGTSWEGSLKLGGDGQPDYKIEMQPKQTVYNKMCIKLEYADKGSLNVNFYSSYWIVNKTNLSIMYQSTKSSDDTYRQLASDTEPLLYECPSKNKKIMLKLHGCDWSKSFSLDAVGNAGDLVCEETKTSREYEMAITIELSSNRLTKIITVMPKFVIINKTEHVLSICETEQKNELWIIIKPDQCVPFWPTTKSNAFLVKLSDSILTSKVVRVDSLFPAIFRVGGGVLMEMSTEITESSTTIVFSHFSAHCLPKLENLCEDIAIRLHQRDAGATTILSPLTSIVYLWDEPGGELTLLWQPENYHVQPEQLPVNKDGFGKLKLFSKRRKSTSAISTIAGVGRRSRRRHSEPVKPSEFKRSKRRHRNENNVERTIYWMSFLDGFQRVIIFTDDPICAAEARKHCEGEPVCTEIFLSLHGVRLSVVNQKQSEIMYLGISSATSVWEVEKSAEKWKTLSVETSSILEEAWRKDIRIQKLAKDVEVDFETMTLIKPYRGALNRRCEPGLWLHYCSSVNYESFSAKVHRVQIDNQIFGTIFPCVLYPSPLPTYITQRYGFKPFFEASAIYRNEASHNFLHLRYFKVLIQEMNIKLERQFLCAIYNLLYGDHTDEQDEGLLFQQHLRTIALTLQDTLIKSGSLDTQRLFLEDFHLSPLKVNLSLSLKSNLYQSEQHGDSNLFQVLVDSVGSPLTEVNDVEIKLAYFERAGLFTTQSSLISSARKHYTWQAVRQFHAIALGLDVLGNPYGLLTDIGEGIKDLFYEPYQGIVLGPQEFATGLARGVKSLLGHAIGGTAGAMSRITGTFGQMFASMSFDQDYRMKRRLRMASGPSGIQEGVAMGGKSFLMGLVFGVSGVVTKPIQGARADGVEGFFKGFGKGILGLVTRPTVGVFDMVSTTLDGIKRSAEQDGEDVVVRMRLPRFSPPNAPLRPYIEYQANGNAILQSLPRSKQIVHGVYIDHTPLPKDGHASIAIFTNVRVMEVHQNVFWSEWKINMDIPYEDVADNARLTQGAIEICMKTNDRVRIESTDQSTLQIVQKKLDEQLYHFRATK